MVNQREKYMPEHCSQFPASRARLCRTLMKLRCSPRVLQIFPFSILALHPEGRVCVCVCMCVCVRVRLVMSYSLRPHGVSSVYSISQTRILEWHCHFLLQGISQTQGSNPRLLNFLHWQVDCLPWSHLGSPSLGWCHKVTMPKAWRFLLIDSLPVLQDKCRHILREF